jgi:hypothetical protein
MTDAAEPVIAGMIGARGGDDPFALDRTFVPPRGRTR